MSHDPPSCPPPDLVPVRRALISVSDKTGLIDFARELHLGDVEIVSTGGTAHALADAGLTVIPVDRVTGFPEIMDGRVKTLHPTIHGGILAVRDHPEHAKALRDHAITPIDLVCVNLYPFERTIAKPGVLLAEAVENIDIGGPSMVRSAAKNHAYVAVVTDPAQYAEVLKDLRSNGGSTSLALRRRLAAAAFARTAAYDSAIAAYFNGGLGPGPDSAFPDRVTLSLTKSHDLRYGENPHQKAALYRTPNADVDSLVNARQLHGKELSYNNINDAAAAWELVREAARAAPGFSHAACVVKHMNPCGAAAGNSTLEAVNAAIAGDPLAAYGGILALAGEVDDATAERLAQNDVFLEVLVAEHFAPEALDRLKSRWANIRLLEMGSTRGTRRDRECRALPGGGFLVQDRDSRAATPSEYQHRAGPPPTPQLLVRAAFLECVARSLLSNAVCLGGVAPGESALRLFGAGAGQMDRVTACRLAAEKAGPLAKGATAYSDAYFPFSDGPKILIDAGACCLIHPGGSKRDQETFDLCNARGVTCLTTGLRHFRH